MYVCTDIHTYAYTYICIIYVSVCVPTHTHTHTHTLLHTNAHTHSCACGEWRRHSQTCALICVCRHTQVVAIGRNYKLHAEELQNAVPTEPFWFLKPPSAYVLPVSGYLNTPSDSVQSMKNQINCLLLLRSELIIGHQPSLCLFASENYVRI